MLYSRMFIPTAKQAPKDAAIQSHILMIRAGLIRKVASGIYSLLPLGYRTVKKVENIIREDNNVITIPAYRAGYVEEYFVQIKHYG